VTETVRVTVNAGVPGGLPYWRARWLVAGGWRALLFAVVIAPPVVGLAVLALGTGGFGVALSVVVAAVVAAWVARSDGVAVTGRRQPELAALVGSVADRCGVRHPTRVRLVGSAEVAARVRFGRRELHVGQPLVDCLSPAELAALIGAELWLLDQPRPGLLVGLRRVWVDAVEAGGGGGVRRRVEPFAAAVVPLADRAAIAAAGSAATAARAYVVATIASGEHDLYLYEVAPPVRWWSWQSGRVIGDLDDGWRRRLDRGIENLLWDDEEAAALATLHPAPDRVRVEPLSTRERHRLVRQVRNIPVQRVVWWTTFAQAPDHWWRKRATTEAEPVRDAAAGLAGRPLTDDVDVIDTLIHGGAAEANLLELVESVLLDAGWRLEHPAVRHVVVAPDGTHVGPDQIRAALCERPAGYPTLRRWLAV
jgi:hypothetical protein